MSASIPGAGYILVEGHGEVKAAQNLVVRLASEDGCPLVWRQPLRWLNLHQWDPASGRGGLRGGVEFVRRKRDAAALLILRDEDDACPKDLAPAMAKHLRLILTSLLSSDLGVASGARMLLRRVDLEPRGARPRGAKVRR